LQKQEETSANKIK